MGVYQRHERGGAWYYRFKIDTVKYKGKCVMPDGKPPADRFEALQCEKAEREAIAKDAPRPKYARVIETTNHDATLEEAFAWHVAKIQDEASASHLASYGRHAREALEFFGEGKRIRTLDDRDMTNFRAAVIRRKRRIYVGGPEAPDRSDESLWKELAQRRAPSEQNHVLNALRSALTDASKLRDAKGQPLLAFVPTIERVHEPKRLPTPMATDEMNRRRAVAPPWVQDAIDLARHFGLRLSEALSAELSHLDYERKGLVLAGEEVKAGNDQFCFTTPEGWEVAKRLARQARQRGVRHLITWPKVRRDRWERPRGGKVADLVKVAGSTEWQPLKSIRRAWNQTAVAAGIEKPRRFHDLRAAYITEVAKVEKSGKKIQNVARHASFTTTERYIAIADSEMVGVMDSVANARRGNLTMPAPANGTGARRPTPAKRRKAR